MISQRAITKDICSSAIAIVHAKLIYPIKPTAALDKIVIGIIKHYGLCCHRN